jgi:sirohydrochlorin cobaltochelatase
MQGRNALVLFAHGARDARWSASLHALAEAIRPRVDPASIRIAFLELQSPTLPEALEAAAAEGARRIHVLPVFWAGAGHIDNELPALLAEFGARRPEVAVRVLPVLSELPGLIEFIAQVVAGSIGDDPFRPAAGKG